MATSPQKPVSHDEPAAGGCSGCGGECIGETPAVCRGPTPVPWLEKNRCMYFYEVRQFGTERFQVRITYQHCLMLVGRQQGPLLYTTTLLPGESISLYEFDRYRRTRSETQRFSVHTSFRQTLSSLSQSRRATSTSAYFDAFNQTRVEADASISAGGGLAGFLGAPQVKGSTSFENETTIASGSSVRTAAEQFTSFAVTASQAIEAERSTVVSTFEDQEHQSTTRRTLQNHNRCYAVTYFVRRVNEVYEASSKVLSIEWRIGNDVWRSIADVPDNLRKQLETFLKGAPKPGEEARDARPITLPTDGTLYEAELAHCSSCEPARAAEVGIAVERARIETRKACLEAELLALEVERRRQLAADGNPVALEIAPHLLGDESAPAPVA
jgi:thermitase